MWSLDSERSDRRFCFCYTHNIISFRHCLAICLLGLSVVSACADQLPLFDGHLHYSGDAWLSTPPERAIQLLDEAHIDRALLSSTPIEGTLKLYALDPKRFVPELRVYHKATSYETWLIERANWWRADDTLPFLENELKRGIYKGIGEFHLFGVEAESDVMRKLVNLSVERKLHLHAHSDAQAIATLIGHNAKVKMLWAHAGISTPVEVVAEWMEKFPQITVELSYHYDVVSGDDSKLTRSVWCRPFAHLTTANSTKFATSLQPPDWTTLLARTRRNARSRKMGRNCLRTLPRKPYPPPTAGPISDLHPHFPKILRGGEKCGLVTTMACDLAPTGADVSARHWWRVTDTE